MASRTIIEMTDDLDGGQADETVTFALDGQAFEIDLSTENAKALRDSVAEFVAAGRRVRAAAARPAATTKRRSSRDDVQAVREWAKGQGFTVSDRGRIPAQVQSAYDAAQR
jgi:hypothetical protein